jgi:hypothetical protein
MDHTRKAKSMAKALRAALAERHIDISHSDSLELVARQYGLHDWNTLAARLGADPPAFALPEGWTRYVDGDERYYVMGLDPEAGACARIECVAPPDAVGEHFGTLMQPVLADDFRGQRLCLTAELQGERVDRGAIWMRVDGLDGKTLGFDNLQTRPGDGVLGGTFGWTPRSIVLDVPPAAQSLHFGALLMGAGTLRARKFRLEPTEELGVTVPPRLLPRTPLNLDFDKGQAHPGH